ncbi:hypothetical protein ACFLS1_00370 [Verrucomicrobiota bacterium]
MEENKIRELVFGVTFEKDDKKRLTCPDAFKLAAEHDVELLDIARVCNKENIRFCKCQLGCFK